MKKYQFKDFLASPEGIATNILSDRLKKLEAQDIISKAPDPESRRQVLYRLTPKGKALIPVLVDLAYWGGTYDTRSASMPEMMKRIKEDRDAVIAELSGALE